MKLLDSIKVTIDFVRLHRNDDVFMTDIYRVCCFTMHSPFGEQYVYVPTTYTTVVHSKFITIAKHIEIHDQCYRTTS